MKRRLSYSRFRSLTAGGRLASCKSKMISKLESLLTRATSSRLLTMIFQEPRVELRTTRNSLMLGTMISETSRCCMKILRRRYSDYRTRMLALSVTTKFSGEKVTSK